MDKRKEQGLAPFSSDECPNSGEDSDEDVITDYLGCSSAQPECAAIGVAGDDTKDSQHQQQTNDKPMDNSAGGATATMADQAPPQQQQVPAANPLVPIISVTPHSPGVARHYPVLEDPLRHLHEIHDKINQMRDLTLVLGNRGDHLQRFSTSCPSLCPLISIDGVIQTGASAAAQHPHPHQHQHHHHGEQDGSDPDLLTNCSTNSSPTHYHPTPGHQQVSQILQGIDRRKSWTGLEDSRQQRRGSDQNHLQAQNIRQRSISLSSLDSDMDLELDGKTRTRDQSGKPRTSVSQSSTHSLNEADFVQGEFKKVAVKRGGQRLGENVGLMPGVTGSRLPFQKSVSTPSIVIPPPGQNLTDTGSCGAPSLSASRHEKGSGSETETDDLHMQHGNEFHEDLMREGTPSTQASLDELLTDTAYEDRHSEKTKRKRGSLFSRKKKDKSGKKPAQPHTWAQINVSSQGNNTCDFCMKSFANKPALHCENCGAIIHQSQACKDHYQQECKQSKPPSKSSFKSLSSVSISSSSSIVKRGSTVSLPLPASMSGRDNNNKKAVTSYSPWRRVATKLGVNQTINEERDGGEHKDIPSGQEEFEFDDSHQFNLEEFDREHPELGLGFEEPETWGSATGLKKLVSKNDQTGKKHDEAKRQEHIYEFILTEKHHCLVLVAMQRIFVEGLQRYFNFSSSVLDRMFPKLQSLMNIHFEFLRKLRQRQRENVVVDTIADILIEQFSGENSSNMKNAYGEFCSRHRDAVEVYKHHQQTDMRFARFVRHCQNNPLLKKKGVHECITFVTQRVTKYPLLIEALIKTGVTSEETDNLCKALNLVKDILNEVNACVADKERTDRKLDIYHKIDPKSYAWYRGQKFKKSDILASNRNLKFDGQAVLMPNRAGKTTSNKPGTEVTVVILTDVLFFLAGDQKYVFFSPDNKVPSIVSLSKLLVREIAGTEKRSENRGIYLISSNPNDPEMFELKLKEPRDKNTWIKDIRAAVEACPQEPDAENNFIDNNFANEIRDARSLSLSKLSSIDKIKHAKETHIQNLIEQLRKNDEGYIALFEEKYNIYVDLNKAYGIPTDHENDAHKMDKDGRVNIEPSRYMYGNMVKTALITKDALDAYREISAFTNLMWSDIAGVPLSRSLSSAGERHSDAYVPPSLAVPRRAETFAGFDHNKERYPCRDSMPLNSLAMSTKSKSDEVTVGEAAGETKDEDETDQKEKHDIQVQLTHNVHTLIDIINSQNTIIENMRAQLSGIKDGNISKLNHRPNSTHQLEELRNLQDQLSRERAEFRAHQQQERTRMDEERAELKRLRANLANDQEDVANQREQLYRKLEYLEKLKQSVSNPVVPVVAHIPSSGSSETSQTSRKKSQTDEKGMIPQNLFSTTNQQKVQQLPVKQQLPLKLASGNNNSNSRSSIMSNNSPDRHSRTGSSPAMVGSSSALSSPELGTSSNGSSSLSHFSMSNRSLRNTRIPEPYPRRHHVQQQQATPPPQQQQQQQQKTDEPLEEQVLFL
ncbi:A-kinase anchor protein 13 isoform X2 [Phymastichus coffea]|uniref:A-kinase anchor protein 13 isoform X2 n=1 Tax=Phymastichus coffea TaxID=108790 RepID=UPI00273BB4AB|nr:A-kinase anchor protein 13 isoform X2 [Phymastichus coffea]XP_058807397.1 A-kinase anchor protein 13 isoform X2 [Phymastichus coffea]XP_058807398.1 A-kinase anchor protein 13 isoform X2 [Phymastichus coffea]XP_058807399.1 A-kinase anchor protein 13 isoform X2 [Phymastichus coffea]